MTKEAWLANYNEVGGYFGALKKAIWEHLKTDRRVKSYRLGNYGEGDSGVTVVELK